MNKSKLVLLSKSAIQANQPLLFPIYNRKRNIIAEKGVVLSSAQVKKILEVSEVFTIDQALKSAAISNGTQNDKDVNKQITFPHQRLSSVEDTLQSICEYPSSSTASSKLINSIARLQSVCKKSPDAAIAKIITDTNDNYAVRHALHTAILCELAATHLRWSTEKRSYLVGAALTMNLSLGFMQDELLDQAKPLNKSQKQIIHDHPTDSVEMLKQMGINNPEWLEYVGKHHESIDGSGYPNACHQKDIPLGALLINLSDVYCAKVSGRNYREPIYANVATRDIFLEKDNTDKGTLIEIFVKILGLYPPGCYVRLKNKELGIVIKRGKQINAPVVRVISEDIGEQVVSKSIRQVDDKNYAIKEIVAVDSICFDVNYDDVWNI